MKKTFILTLLFTLGATLAMAQLPDSLQIQNEKYQQEQLRLEQEQEQQRLRFEQEQEQLRIEQEQEQQKILEEQEQERQKELRQQEKAEKRAQRKERREAIGRKLSFSLDPYVGINLTSRLFQYAEPYYSDGLNLGADFAIHYPLSKKFDINVGVGYRLTAYMFSNNIIYDPNTSDFVFLDYANYYRGAATLGIHSLQFPITISYLKNKNDKNKYYFLGFNVGYNFTSNFGVSQLNSDNKYDSKYTEPNPANLKQWKLDLVLGYNSSWLIFRPTVQIHVNLLPTYIDGTNNGNPIHEIGVTVKL